MHAEVYQNLNKARLTAIIDSDLEKARLLADKYKATAYSSLKELLNQEDIDFIVAFNKDDIYHLVLIEAKAESGWTNKQLSSKAEKFKSIFGFNNCVWENVRPYFLITSPRKPTNLRVDALPIYLQGSMDDICFKLCMPDYLVKITRCNENGKLSISGTKWKVERTG